MALLTPMRLDEAQALGGLFGLSVVAHRPVLRGSVNSNFELRLDSGERAFLRVCEQASLEAVRQQNRLLELLVDQGVPTPAPIERCDGGGTVAEHAAKPVAVFPFCEGDWICQGRVEARHLERVGEVLAAIHSSGARIGVPAGMFGAEQLTERLAVLRGQALSKEIAADVEALGEALAEVTAATGEHPGDVVIHGDVFRDNVLWHADGRLSALLDFETACLGHPAFDLMVTMLAWCFGDRLEQPLARALVAGYCRRRALSGAELGACFGQARQAALRFAITRISDYELRPRGVVTYKDYRRFVARLRAIEEIGGDRFVEWLGAD